MPNTRHERFAQALVKGLSATEASTEAGYTGDRGAASRLSANANIRARVAELQRIAANQAVFTVETITANLSRIAEKAERVGDSAGLSVARASNMDIAKLLGLIVDRSEVNATVRSEINAEPLSEDEWMKRHVVAETGPH